MKSNGSKRPSATEIEFRADELLQSLLGHANHLEGRQQLTMRVRTLSLPSPIKDIKPREIVSIRSRLHVSQPVFATLLNVPVTTARSWEQGKRKPSGAALRLLDIARRQPAILIETH